MNMTATRILYIKNEESDPIRFVAYFEVYVHRSLQWLVGLETAVVAEIVL